MTIFVRVYEGRRLSHTVQCGSWKAAMRSIPTGRPARIEVRAGTYSTVAYLIITY